MSIRCLTPILLALVATTLVACGGDSGSGSDTAAVAWLVTEMPSGAVDVAEAKKTASEGDQVVVRGKIGGRRDPISVDSAVFVMMDPALPTCADRPGDNCPTPWDYCCETPESKTANNATVQIVDASGQPLQLNVAEHGLAPMAEIIVVGTVGPRTSDTVLVIKASRVHVVGG